MTVDVRVVIEGVVDGTLANHALAFVVRGIIHRWKQPFDYFWADVGREDGIVALRSNQIS